MAWSIAAHTTAQNHSGSPTVTGAIDTTGADVIIVGVTNTDATVTDSKGNTNWTLIGSTSFNTTQALFYYESRNPTVGTGHTFTNTSSGGGGHYGIAVVAVTGSLTSADPVDKHNEATQNFVSTIQPGSISPAQDNSLIVSFITQSDTDAVADTINSSFSILDQPTVGLANDGLIGSAYLLQVTAAAINPTWDVKGSRTTVCAGQVSLKPGISTFFGDAALTAVATLTPAVQFLGDAALTAVTVLTSSGSSYQLSLPISDVNDGVWTTETGATTNLYASVGEPTPYDYTFIQSENSPINSQVTLRLGPQPVQPATGNVILSIRHGNNASYGTMQYSYELMQGANVIQLFGPYSISTTTIAEIDLTVTNSITDWTTPFDVRITANQTA